MIGYVKNMILNLKPRNSLSCVVKASPIETPQEALPNLKNSVVSTKATKSDKDRRDPSVEVQKLNTPQTVKQGTKASNSSNPIQQKSVSIICLAKRYLKIARIY